MLRQSIMCTALIGCTVLAGCAAGASFDPKFGRSRDEGPTQLAAYAAKADYPRDEQPRDDLRAAAVVNQDKGTVRIYNFSDRALGTADVWVNGTYVYRVDAVPPKGSVTLPLKAFFDRDGRVLNTKSSGIDRVQVEIGDDLYNLEGPVYE